MDEQEQRRRMVEREIEDAEKAALDLSPCPACGGAGWHSIDCPVNLAAVQGKRSRAHDVTNW